MDENGMVSLAITTSIYGLTTSELLQWLLLLCQIQVVVNNQNFLFDTDKSLILFKTSLLNPYEVQSSTGLWFSLICCWLMIKTRAEKEIKKDKRKAKPCGFLRKLPPLFQGCLRLPKKQNKRRYGRRERWDDKITPFLLVVLENPIDRTKKTKA